MNRLFFLFLLSLFYYSTGLFLSLEKVIHFDRPFSLEQVVYSNFVKDLYKNNKKVITEKLRSGDIHLSYCSSRWGYQYNSSYIINEENGIYNIFYENNFVKNQIYLYQNKNDLHFNITCHSNYPVPKGFLKQMVNKKLKLLDTTIDEIS